MLTIERTLVRALGLVACVVDLVRMAAAPASDRAHAHDGLRAGLEQIGGGEL
jgi:hypothetical protein